MYNIHFFFTLFITAHTLKLVQQYSRLNTVTMVIFVAIFITMDMEMLYKFHHILSPVRSHKSAEVLVALN